MTDHDSPDSPDSHPVDGAVTAAIGDAQRRVRHVPTEEALDAARAARDRHGRSRRRRVRTVTLGTAAAVVLVVVATALALGDPGRDPELVATADDPGTTTSVVGPGSTSGTASASTLPPASSSTPLPPTSPAPTPTTNGSSTATSPTLPTTVPNPAPLPIPPVEAPDRCPSQPVQRNVFDVARGDENPLLDFTPTEVIVCIYQFTDQAGGSILGHGDVDRLVRGLAALEPVPDDLVCTMEMGPTVGVIATGGTHTATIWLQLYGCGLAFNGDHHRIGAKSLSWLAG